MSQEFGELFNFRRLSRNLTTSGQPTESQFALLRDAGIGTIINLALADSPGALPDQHATLIHLGMTYVHIPVDFAAPDEADFARFSAVMDELGDVPIHIHCAANYRVSAFLYRYRRTHLGWREDEARSDLLAVWSPDDIWRAFIDMPA